MDTNQALQTVIQFVKDISIPGLTVGVAALWIWRSNGSVRQNRIFIGILASALYLSVVAIVSVPSLLESTEIPDELRVDRLKQTLDSIEKEDGASVQDLSDQDPLNALDAFLLSSPGAQPSADLALGEAATRKHRGTSAVPNLERGGATGLGSPSKVMGQTRAQVSHFRNERDSLRNRLKILNLQSQAEERKDKFAALTAYQYGNVNRKGNRERVEHFSNLLTWFSDRTRKWDSEVADRTSYLGDFDNLLRGWSIEVQKGLTSQSGDGVKKAEGALENYFAAALPKPDRDGETPKPRPEIGSGWGYFRAFSWVARTESLPFGLIIGLLGFGLLGSASSTFVRQQTAQGNNELLVNNLAAVIIRGFSAAIVVFLGVEGGLSVFGSGSKEPNPYALFFTCLVAAVYSETIWKKVQKYIEESLESKNSSGSRARSSITPPHGEQVS